jgi:hypothetical protein
LQQKDQRSGLPKTFLGCLTFAKVEQDWEKLNAVLKALLHLQVSINEAKLLIIEYHQLKRLQIQLTAYSHEDSWEIFAEKHPGFSSKEVLVRLLTKLGPMKEAKGDGKGPSRGGKLEGWYTKTGELHPEMKTFLVEAAKELQLRVTGNITNDALKNSQYTNSLIVRTGLGAPFVVPFCNRDVKDMALRHMQLYYQVRKLDLSQAMTKLPKQAYQGIFLDVMYDMDTKGAYTPTTLDELMVFLRHLKTANIATHYSICIFCSAKQVEPFKGGLEELFDRVERRYWDKQGKDQVLPGGDKVSSDLEHFLLAFKKPAGEEFRSWQFAYNDVRARERSNVFRFARVVQGVYLDGKVRVSKQPSSSFHLGMKI